MQAAQVVPSSTPRDVCAWVKSQGYVTLTELASRYGLTRGGAAKLAASLRLAGRGAVRTLARSTVDAQLQLIAQGSEHELDSGT